MDNLENEIKNIKSSYREFFLKFAGELNKCVYDSKPKSLEGEIFDTYPENSEGYIWQKSVLKLINDGIAPDTYKKLVQLKEYRKNEKFQCKMCGACCKLAVSEFSPDELKEKATAGDNFATQFLSVFIPYENIEDAKKNYPEYFELIKNTTDEKAYYYHCPKVTSDNKCPIYDERPQICKDFPDNPFAFLPKTCGYKKWKSEVLNDSLKLQAIVEIIEFYKNKLKNIR